MLKIILMYPEILRQMLQRDEIWIVCLQLKPITNVTKQTP